MATVTSKAAIVRKLLSRGKGATLVEVGKATGWQPHSCRAFLTRVRKTGALTKEQRTDGAVAYRLASSPQIRSREGAKPTKDGGTVGSTAEEAVSSDGASQ